MTTECYWCTFENITTCPFSHYTFGLVCVWMDVHLFVLLHNSSFCSIKKKKKTCYTAVQVLHSDLSSWCSLFLSWTSSCPCGVSSSCVHWTLLKLQKNLSLRSRCCSCQRNWTKLVLFSWTCCLSAAPYWVWELLQKIKNQQSFSLFCLFFLGRSTSCDLWPSVTGLGEANAGTERTLVRFSIWFLRNFRSCIRSSTCRSRAAMRSCLLSNMHCSLVMVSSTRGGRFSKCEAGKVKRKRKRKKSFFTFGLHFISDKCCLCKTFLDETQLFSGFTVLAHLPYTQGVKGSKPILVKKLKIPSTWHGTAGCVVLNWVCRRSWLEALPLDDM